MVTRDGHGNHPPSPPPPAPLAAQALTNPVDPTAALAFKIAVQQKYLRRKSGDWKTVGKNRAEGVVFFFRP